MSDSVKLKMTERAFDVVVEQRDTLRSQLAASQAEVARMRETLRNIAEHHCLPELCGCVDVARAALDAGHSGEHAEAEKQSKPAESRADRANIGADIFPTQAAPVIPNVGKIAPFPEASPWRVGSKVGRTIYRGPASTDLIGMMDTPEMAALVVEAVNAYSASTRPPDMSTKSGNIDTSPPSPETPPGDLFAELERLLFAQPIGPNHGHAQDALSRAKGAHAKALENEWDRAVAATVRTAFDDATPDELRALRRPGSAE